MKPLSSFPIGFHFIICDANKKTNILRGDHEVMRVSQRYLHSNGTANGNDNPLVSIGDAGLSETGGNSEGNKRVSGSKVSALDGDDEGLESEDEFRLS